jgi:phage virion morphogenesis protein
MSDPYIALEHWVEPMLTRLSSAQRRELSWKIARMLRRSQHARVQAQTDAQGRAFLPRKQLRDQAGRIRRQRGKLFRRLTQSDWLKVRADDSRAVVGFVGRVARIARAHQEGLVDQVRPGGPSVRYPERRILGITPQDREAVLQLLLEHFGGAA